MAWFSRKKSPDVIDFTKLQKEGVLQRSQETRMRQATESESGVIDFTQSQSFSSQNTGSASTSSDPGASALGFLSNLAGSGAANTSNDTGSHVEDASYGSYTDRLKLARKSKLAEFNSMKIKLEDTEFKLNKVLERLDRVERKLGEFENRTSY